MRRIHHDRAELITPAGERGPDSCKVLAFMREVRVPQTFSSTIMRGGRPSVARALINFQKGQNVPDRSPLRPSPAPARERS